MINYIELLKSKPQYFKQFSCKELLFLNYDCPVKEDKLAKWSEHNYFYYVLTGKKILHTTHRSWELTTGTVVFVKRGACIVEQFFREPFCIVVFVMPDSFISKFIAEHRNQLPKARPHTNTDDLVIPVKSDALLRAFYDSVLPYFTSIAPPPEKLIELKFNELLLHIVNNPENGELISFMHEVAEHKSGNLEQVMEANFAYHLDLHAYARLCNRSLSSFKRDFQALYHTTPGRWLLEKRLMRARELLMTTDKSMGEIILESGFESQPHFSRAFKTRYGLSPLQFRKAQDTIVV